ncbi:O-acetylhomoserine aminocarboxypropyltransferase/cysteine synthase family protein [Endomicrobium proavitum]|uniref:O-acetylhomoserine (Thiol)-lyase n=1 Tax=Endomicrobium proavitum TaxID=1408281 RepID=A0A0G3WJK3_9BACT|nr:aminotransferase class I/II-fold pyridoxal phosphate-dependent enzyme [Endomicrobium proavitum]AKL98060.1 O-acetylhomoserine (thiol)-lyase [Endomicrobium proavitum]
MSGNKHKFDTLKIRAGYNPKDHNYAVSVPIYQTASYDLGGTERANRIVSFQEDAWLYSRINNPTVDVLEKRVAALDGAAAGLALSSGMAAVTYTLFVLAEGGGRILTSPYLYGGTFDSFKSIINRFNINIDFSKNIDNIKELEKEIKPDTKAIFIESISNPNGAVADIEALAALAHKHNIPLVVDNTIATPYLFNPIQHGADIVIYSATKALSGHGNVIAGIILDSGAFKWDEKKFPQIYKKHYTLRDDKNNPRSYTEVFKNLAFIDKARMDYLNYFGSTLGAFDAYLVLIGIETLSERVQKQVSNTAKILEYLEKSPYVAKVNHPTLKSSDYYGLALKYFPKGAGSVLSFEIKGTLEQGQKFIDALKIFTYLANIGDAKSLVIDPFKVTHGELTPEDLELAKIPLNLIRLSIGLEDADDLTADLDQAFKTALK